MFVYSNVALLPAATIRIGSPSAAQGLARDPVASMC